MRGTADFWLAMAALTDTCFELDDYEKSYCH